MLERLKNLLPFNPGKPKVQLGVGILLVLLVAGFATKCHAEDSYMQFGGGSTVVRGPAAIADIAAVYPDLGPGDATVEFGATFLGMSNYEGSEQRNNFALRAAVVDGFGHFDVGLGSAYLQNTDTYNGSHLNFVLLLGYRGEKWGARLQHFSNGGTQAPNKGRDMVYVFRMFK